MNKREREDQRRRRFEGYYEGASGRSSQFEWDDTAGVAGQSYGDDANWKNSRRAVHHNNDHFGYGSRDRAWDKHLDNRREEERNHFGKGPKGYQRSSERIREEACEALTHSPHVDASDIEINVEDGIVTLTGTVESRRVKKEAERVVDTVLGVEDVVNLLKMVGEPKADREVKGPPNFESKTGNWS
jgi:uncharacterized protein (DUF927 family)